MSVSAPSLNYPIGATTYQTEIDNNFSHIQTFCSAVASELNADLDPTSSTAMIQNMQWIAYAMGTAGVVGTDSFVVSFDTAEENITISHPTLGSACVIGGRIHTNDTDKTADLTTIVTVDGTYRMAIGVHSAGAPICEIKVVESTGATEDASNDIDLLLYTFQLVKSGSSYDVSELRRGCEVILSQDTFNSLVFQEIPLSICSDGTMPSADGDTGFGMIVPFDCEIMGCYARLGTTATTPGAEMTLYLRYDGSDILTLAPQFEYGQDGEVKSATASSEPTQVPAGGYLSFYQNNTGVGYWNTASRFSATVMIRKLYNTI